MNISVVSQLKPGSVWENTGSLNHVRCSPNVYESKATACNFGNGLKRLQRAALISFSQRSFAVPSYAHIPYDAAVSHVFCSDEIRCWELRFNKVANCLVRSPTGHYLSVISESAYVSIKRNSLVSGH